MANKKIIVSDGNGKYREIASSSFSVDGEKLTIATASVATSSYGGGTSGSIMQIVDDRLIPIWSTSSILERFDSTGTEIIPSNLSGTLFQYRTDDTTYKGISLGRVDTPSFSGDIVGTTGSAFPAKVVSVANVQSGTLDSRFGGTGTGSFIVNSLVTLSGSGLDPSGASDKIAMIDATNKWSFQDKNLLNFAPLTGAIFYLYTGSVSNTLTTSNFIWKKPGTDGAFPANVGTPRFIRIICQGAGGGGGGGGALGGIGGAGGAYTDIIYDAPSINSSVTCSIGWGGSKGAANVNGSPGASSSFGTYIYSSGGAGGLAANNTLANAATGGVGYMYTGGTGSARTGGSPAAVSTVLIGGAGGGGGASGTSGVNAAGAQGGSNTLLSLTASAGGATSGGSASPPQSGTLFYGYKCYINNVESLIDLPYLLWAGGSGGGYSLTTAGSGSSPLFGSGGGGGGRGGTGGNGGDGGRGYILIICT